MSDADADVTADATLATAYLSGDRDALATIYDRYAHRLFDVATAMMRDRHEAADIVQDTFLIAAERMSQLRDPARLKPWLFAIARHEIYRRSKRRARTVPTDFNAEGAVVMPAHADPAADGAALDHEQLAELVRSAASGLDARDQLVLELSVRQGLHGADLAAALGITPEQSYTVVHRMRDRVDRSLGALAVARAGRRDCPELANILRGWDGAFTVLIRKRVARHVERCETCERTKRSVAPIALLGAASASAAPAGLRVQVLTMTAAIAITEPGTLEGEAASAGRLSRRYDFAHDGGFPRAVVSSARRALVAVGGLAAAVLTVGGSLALADRDPMSPRHHAAAPTASDGRRTDPPATTPLTTMHHEPTTGPTSTPPPITTAPPPDSTVSTAPEPPTTSPPAPATIAVVPSTAPADPTPPTTTPTVATTTPATVDITATPPATTTPAVLPAVPPPPPGELSLSSTMIDFGEVAMSAGVTITNVGGQSVSIDVGDPTGPFDVAGAPSSLAPGATAELGVTFARPTAGEGDHAATIAVHAGAQHMVIHVHGVVEIRPVVAITTSPTGGQSCRSDPRMVTATATDSSGIDRVLLGWSGPKGISGRAPMTADGDGSWNGAIAAATTPAGAWTYTVTAVDTRGNTASATGAYTVTAC